MHMKVLLKPSTLRPVHTALKRGFITPRILSQSPHHRSTCYLTLSSTDKMLLFLALIPELCHLKISISPSFSALLFPQIHLWQSYLRLCCVSVVL